ncbi:MAG: formylglycine-generating enzyme family protein, partial [Betaproteobacteria bacterium]|nr:formylglycine-generating enzyme family protein [Betaproteobacteria bacterium]
PPFEVSIARSLAVGRYEIARRQFAAFGNATGHAARGCYRWSGAEWVYEASLDWRDPGFSQGDEEPVVCVAWADAAAYVRWLSATTGQPYRLLSEAEWEYAARAGTTTSRYWGDSADAGCDYANLGDRSMRDALGFGPFADCSDGYARTAPVGRFLPNAFGLYDMLGNVWEWTADCWREGYSGAPADGTAWTSEPCARRTNRGAGWNSHPRDVRSSNRGSYAPVPYESVGIRVAR